MELTTLKLLFAGGLVVMTVAIMLVLLALHRLVEWVKSRGGQAASRKSAIAGERAPHSGHAWRSTLP